MHFEFNKYCQLPLVKEKANQSYSVLTSLEAAIVNVDMSMKNLIFRLAAFITIPV